MSHVVGQLVEQAGAVAAELPLLAAGQLPGGGEPGAIAALWILRHW